MGIYTRTGDKGKTSLYAGKRISKANIRVEAYGSVDELNSAIGVALAHLGSEELKSELIKIQSDLFEIGGRLSNPTRSKNLKLGNHLKKRVKNFEKTIDKLAAGLPKLSNFILPGGGKAGSFLHLARTVSRRAERRIVKLAEEENVDLEIIIYMNRLSDLLFMMARFINYKEKIQEIPWKSR